MRSATRRSPGPSSSQYAPTAVVQVARTPVSTCRSAATRRRAPGSSTRPTASAIGWSARISTARAPCAGAGTMIRGSTSSAISSPRPMRSRPAAASTAASTSPVRTMRTRVPTLPRIGTIRRSGRARSRALARRGLEVPTRAPGGRAASPEPSRLTRASWAAARSGTATTRRPGTGAKGRSLKEWTATSTPPSASTSRRRAAKAPGRGGADSGIDRSSPSVRTRTSSVSAPVSSSIRPATVRVCETASSEPRVPRRSGPPVPVTGRPRSPAG